MIMTGYSKELKNLISDLLKTVKRINSRNKTIKANMSLILKETSWLGDVEFSERIYCIKNGILKNPGCEFCGNNVKFHLSGGLHYVRTCSYKCGQINMSDVKRKAKNKKFLNTINNKSDEEKEDRYKRWIETNNNKSDEEKEAIKKKQSDNYNNKSDEEKEAIKKKSFETMIKKNTVSKHTSEPADELCRNIYNQLDGPLKIKTYFGKLNKEFGKWDKIKKCYYKYDFVISNIKICIEFNGDKWHPNPNMSEEEWDKWKTIHKDKKLDRKLSADEVYKKNQDKLDILRSQGFSVLEVWDSDYRNDPDTVLNECIEYIKDHK